MDALDTSASPTFASLAPLHIGEVALTARDLPTMTGFYRELLGVSVIEQTDGRVRLGVGDVGLVTLEHRPGALPDDPREAGLYHTAFLMPTRRDLGRWLLRVAQKRVPLTGASDHAVSEAIYLDDPEGNGIEVYADRPREAWPYVGGEIEMTTDPLDVPNLAASAEGAAPYAEAPGGLRIGHIHLRVGDTRVAEQFYHGVLGLDVTRRYRVGATFMSSGGYHHHVGSNVWHSRGAGRRDDNRAGLSWFSMAHDRALDLRSRFTAAGVPVAETAGGFEVRDPWGTRVRFVPA